jgi:hypothetical protein
MMVVEATPMNSWTLGGFSGAHPVAAPALISVEDLLKAYEAYAERVAASFSASRRASSMLSARYPEVLERVKAASETLNADLAAVHEQFEAEVTAATKSPLVDRCKATYRTLVEAYTRELAAMAAAAGPVEPQLDSETRRAANAYARAVSDLNSELARQVSAAYERYLSGLALAWTEADINGVVAAANEELLAILSKAYRVSGPGEQPTEPEVPEVPSPPGPPEMPSRPVEPESADRLTGSASGDEDLWAGAGTSPWDEADAPTWEEIDTPEGDDREGTVSPWGPVDTPAWAEVVTPDEDEDEDEDEDGQGEGEAADAPAGGTEDSGEGRKTSSKEGSAKARRSGRRGTRARGGGSGGRRDD